MPSPSRYGLAVIGLIATVVAVIGLMISCGSNMDQSAKTGSVTTILSDPPSCAAPGGPIQNVWVTVTKVTANISSTADASDSGWVTLLDLTSNPRQIDLLSLASTACTLTTLGSTSGLPPGNYQQIRLYLLSNTAASGPSPNNCGSGNGFNCVVPTGDVPHELLLSSEAQSGLKIPPGQIAGGKLTVTAGQSVDLQIDFNACSSILQQGNGQYRLKPTLHAGEVAANSNSISGKVIDSVSNDPIAGAVVLLEQFDGSTGVDAVVRSGVTAADGTFIFCPLPGGPYDIVVAAETTNESLITTTYNATIAFLVPAGTNVGNMPLVAETGAPLSTLPATITGQVTTTGALGATPADITLYAVQQATPTGETPILVTIPVFGALSQPPTITTTATPTPSLPACPASTDCYNYALQVPASNPEVGTFVGSNQPISYAAPDAGTVTYSVVAATANCTASVPNPARASSIAVSGGASTAVPTTLAFSACTSP